MTRGSLPVTKLPEGAHSQQNPDAMLPEHRHAGQKLLIFTKHDSTITSGNDSSCKALGAKLLENPEESFTE